MIPSPILLAIVIPCYNEEQVLGKAASVLLRLKEELDNFEMRNNP